MKIESFKDSGIEVLVREDGYINATLLCKGASKQFKHWKERQATFEFIKSLSKEVGITASDLVETKKGGNPQEQGAWVHELVAINLAQWLSPKYAVLVTKVMQKFHRGELVDPSIDIQGKSQIALIAEALLDIDSRINQVNERVDKFENVLVITKYQESVLRNLVKKIATINRISGLAVWCEFKHHFQILRYGELKQVQFESARKYLSDWLELSKKQKGVLMNAGLFEKGANA